MYKIIVALIIMPFLSYSQIENLSDKLDSVPNFDNRSNIENWLEQNKIPAIGIGVIENGKLSSINVYGNLNENRTAPYNTIFKVASLTKPIVSMLTLQLVNNGDWDLDEPLDKYWIDPDILHDSRHKLLTTRHVLTHQTGFLNWRRQHKMKKLAFEFEPGTNFKYSGEGYEYLKNALERKFKMSLEKLSDSLLFKPIGMPDTKFTWLENIDEKRYAFNHNSEGKLLETVRNKKAYASDLLVSTIEDYGKFAAFVINGGGLSKEIYDEMVHMHIKTPNESYFGLGWESIPDLYGEKVLMHSGGDPGVRTLILINLEKKKGLIIFSNSDNGGFLLWEKTIIEPILKE